MTEDPVEWYEMIKKITVFQHVTICLTSRMEAADSSEKATLRMPQKILLFVLRIIISLESKYIYNNFFKRICQSIKL
jgi:hypothetical protein